MPYRAYHIVLGLVGVVAVLTLVLVRSDPDRHARSGPRWKRRLVNAGLLLLAAFGLGPLGGAGCDKRDPAKSGYAYPDEDNRRQTRRNTLRSERRVPPRPEPPPAVVAPPKPVTPPPPAAGLHQEPPRPTPPPGPAALAFRQAAPLTLITEVHDRATAIASGSKGRYPFDKAGKARLLAELTQAQAGCDDLQKAGQLTAAEAALMKQRLARLHTDVNKFRYKGYFASCYSPRPQRPPAELSVEHLSKRLPHLQRLATTGRLHHAVVRKVISAIRADLNVLEDKRQVDRLRKTTDRTRAVALAKKVRRQVDRVSKQLRKPPRVRAGVARTPQWKRYMTAWNKAAPLSIGSRVAVRADYVEAQKLIGAARLAITDLVTATYITADEAQLLRVELARLGMLVARRAPRRRPVKGRSSCYRPRPYNQLKNSRQRLENREWALKGVVKRGRISKAVRDRVMPAIQKDLERVSAKRGLAAFIDDPPKGQHGSSKTDPFVTRMKSLVSRVKKLPTRR